MPAVNHARTLSATASPGNLPRLHGDHAVGQTRLADRWPDAWVNMVPVESRINRAVGAMMEKAPLNIKAGEERVEINAECVLKTFLQCKGALQHTELREYLKQARKRFLSFSRSSGDLSRKSIMHDLYVHTMAANATSFFDQLTRELDLDLIEWDNPLPMILIQGA